MTLARLRFFSCSLAAVQMITTLGASAAFAQQAGSTAPTAPAAAAPAAPPAAGAAGAADANGTPPPMSQTLTGAAKADYESGKLLYGDGDYATAAVKFRRAYEASKEPRLLWNVAACEKVMRHYTKALNLVERYQAQGGALLTAADRKEADDLANALRATTDTLSLTVNIGGADVSIDDETAGTTPLDHMIRVDLGDHKVVVQKAGYTPFSRTVSFGGTGVVLQVALEKEDHSGELRVDADPDDAIVVDGQLQANGSSAVHLPSGAHSLRVSARGKQTYQGDVVVQDHQSTNVHVHLNKEKEGGGSAVPWIIGGAILVVAGGAVATYFAVHKNNDSSSSGTPGTLGEINLSGVRFR